MLVPTSCANIYYRFCFTATTYTLDGRCGYSYIYIHITEEKIEQKITLYIVLSKYLINP